MLPAELADIEDALASLETIRDTSMLEEEDQAAINRMAEYLACLLDAANGSRRPIGSDALTSDGGEEKLPSVEPFGLETGCAGPETVHQLFEAQVRQTPEQIAIAYEGRTLTYAQLNARANQLAYHLRDQGVAPDMLVGIFSERSPEMIIGLLGILKAGGAYLPLDPSYPKDRLAYMLGHAKPVLLLTQTHLREEISGAGIPVLCLDGDWKPLAANPIDDLVNRTLPGNLAYVIYTSGSTGEPKGVSGQVSALVNRLKWMQSVFPCKAGDKYVQKTSINFIDSITETMGPLLFGGQLHIASIEVSRDPQLMWQFIEKNDITRIVLVPSLLEAMLHLDEQNISKKMDMIVCSGEALLPGLVSDARRLLPSTKLLNLYGSSEVTGDVTFYLCRQSADLLAPIPLGRPIANSQIYILDRDLQPVPLGAVGELYVGGRGLARGYLNRPDLTAERFVPNPHSREPGARMYRSGDLARYLPNGDIEYLGRIDHQVKIRGFRIELGEIEAALMRLPQVREAVVLARTDIGGDRRLVAYAVASDANMRLDADDLRSALQRSLPDYMVPTYFTQLENLPLSSNGKIDRRALPAPERIRGEMDYVAPKTQVEKDICDAWKEVLGIDHIGVMDNFFDLGGHSLLVMKLVGRLKKINIGLSVQQIYKNPTIAEMAVCLAKNSDEYHAINQGLIVGAAPLMANHHWFLKRKNLNHWNTVLLLEPLIELDIPNLKQAISDAIEHHDGIRRIFIRDGEEIKQLLQTPEEMAPWWHYVDLSETGEHAMGAAIEKCCADAQVSLDIFSVLFKVFYIHLGKGKNPRLFFVAHRLLLDPVSKPIFYNDLINRYIGLITKNVQAFPDKTTSVKDWAEWQWQYAQEGALEYLPYWRSRAWDKYTALPKEESDVGQLAEVSDSIEPHFVHAELNREETLELEKAAFNSGLQIDCILVAALALAYQEWTGATSLFLLFMTNGRVVRAAEGVDLSRTMGWLPNYSPIMFDWEADDAVFSLTNVVKKIKSQLIELQDDGLSYSCLRYMNADPKVKAEMNSFPGYQLEFSYLPKAEGPQADAAGSVSAPMMRVADEHWGEEEAAMNSTFNPFAKSYHDEGQLKMRWGYSPCQYSRRTMQEFIDNHFRLLREIIKELKKM